MSDSPDMQAKPKTDQTVTPPQPAPGAVDTVTLSRVTLNYIVIAVLFFGVGVLMGAMAFGSSNRTTATVDQATIEQAVQNVLIDGGLMQPPANMTVVADDDPYLGPTDAPVVIVDFSAYACPYCARHYNDTFKPLLENYGQYIRYVYRDFPSINPDVSYPAALAANCALEQDKFWEYHDSIFENQQTLAQLGTPFLRQLASDLELDTDTFNTCLDEEQYLEEINADFNAGVNLGVTGTPSFYINGVAHSGARPYQYFETIILRELDNAGIDY